MSTNIYMKHIPTESEIKSIKNLIDIKDYVDARDALQDIIDKEVHIGKSSYGWQFLFAPNPEYYEETKESILEFLQQSGNEEWQLIDEYENKIDPNTFFDEYVIPNMQKYCLKDYINDNQMEELNKYGITEHITEEGLRFAETDTFC